MLREHSGLLFHCFVGQFFHCTSHTTVAPHVHSLRTGYMDLLLGRENLSPRKETNIKTRFPKGGQLRYTSLCCCEGCRAFFYHKHISISKTTHGIVGTPKFVLQNCLWWPEHKVAWKENKKLPPGAYLLFLFPCPWATEGGHMNMGKLSLYINHVMAYAITNCSFLQIVSTLYT